MSIKTWQSRLDDIANTAYQGHVSQEEIDACISGEIDELRAALQERDAYLEAYKESAQEQYATYDAYIADQRKVLEQAHKALNVAVIQNGCDMLMTGEELRKCEAAITAIQEQLKS